MLSTLGGTIMETVATIVQMTIATVIFFVWTIRFNRDTNYRGGNAKSMREEFRVYGLPDWALPLVGSTKIALAVTLVAGIWIPLPVKTAALFMAALMAGAVYMTYEFVQIISVKPCQPWPCLQCPFSWLQRKTGSIDGLMTLGRFDWPGGP